MSRSRLGSLLELKTPQSEQELLEFREFLRSQFCSENLSFWRDAEEFKSIGDAQERSKKAKAMWEKYCSPESRYELNIPDSLKRDLHQKLENQNFESSVFQTAQQAVFDLMAEQSYPLFLQTKAQPPKSAVRKKAIMNDVSIADFTRYIDSKTRADSHSEQTFDKSNSDSHFEKDRVEQFIHAPRPASFSNLNDFGATITGEDILLKIKAGSLQLTTRVNLRITVGDFVQKQLKKTDFDFNATNTYGLYISLRKQWLDNSSTLADNKELFTNSHLTFELKEMPNL